MSANKTTAQEAIQNARQALKRGDKKLAQRWAARAIALAPDLEAPWLLMAAVSEPQQSIVCLKRALVINPQSVQARKGMAWAKQRLANQQQARTVETKIAAPKTGGKKKNGVMLWLAVFSLLLAAGVLLSVSVSPALAFIRATGEVWHTATPEQNWAQVDIAKPTYTASPTATFTPSPTFTPTPSSTWTPSPTPTFTPTFTPTPTNTPEPWLPPNAPRKQVQNGERWINVDLSEQKVYAFEGSTLIRSFVVSTGTWRTPTVKGQYAIYVKFRYANMSGPGYFLADVPYVMYFYKGYGFHGTYWHNNFGTPMSRGCVNLVTEDAGWLFNWASVGTVVNIHE